MSDCTPAFELTADQTVLLKRMKRAPVAFSGYESDDLRLAMLQLYLAGLVDQSRNSTNPSVIAWRITRRGRVALPRS